jgi:hypothetical protein
VFHTMTAVGGGAGGRHRLPFARPR